MFCRLFANNPGSLAFNSGEGAGYFQIIQAEKTDVCRSYGLCLQAVTNRKEGIGFPGNGGLALCLSDKLGIIGQSVAEKITKHKI